MCEVPSAFRAGSLAALIIGGVAGLSFVVPSRVGFGRRNVVAAGIVCIARIVASAMRSGCGCLEWRRWGVVTNGQRRT